MVRTDTARRLAGVVMIVVGATGLTVTVLDWIGTRQCFIDSQDLLILCANPLPAYLFGLWFALGVLGAIVAARR